MQWRDELCMLGVGGEGIDQASFVAEVDRIRAGFVVQPEGIRQAIAAERAKGALDLYHRRRRGLPVRKYVKGGKRQRSVEPG